MRYLLFLLTTISITSTYIVSSTTFALSIEIDLKTFCSQSPHNTKCKAYDPSNENLQDEKDEKQVNEVLPISINPGSIEPISIAQIQTAIIPGTEIGKLRAGLLHVVQENFYAQGLISTEVQNTYHQIINRELEQFGYSTNTSGNSVGSVFSNVSLNNDLPSRFFIGGTIEDTTLNAYGSYAGNNTKASIKIRWEVLDRLSNKVIFTKTVAGNAKVSGVTHGATIEAFRQSFRGLLATNEFSDTLKVLSQEVPIPSNTTSIHTIAALPASSKSLTVKEITSQSITSVVGIESSKGKGTGFLISKNGFILTNAHVIENDYNVKVKLYDQSTSTAKVIQKDSSSDLALLRLSENSKSPIGLPLCYSDMINVGDETVVIGNPLSLEYSVTRGIISAIRDNNTTRLLQIDAAVNPGNSGGPLINEFGSVVGIVSSKISLQGIEGLGFAIPIGEAIDKLNISIDFTEIEAKRTCGMSASN